MFALEAAFDRFPELTVAKLEVHPHRTDDLVQVAEARAYGWKYGHSSNADELLWVNKVVNFSVRPMMSPTLLWGWCDNRYGSRVPLSIILVERFREDPG